MEIHPLSSSLPLPMPIPLLFDFDYTLADSSAAIVECMNHALRGLGLPEREPAVIQRGIGLSMPKTLAYLAGEEHLPRLPEFMAHFVQRADEIMTPWTEMLPGVAAVLAELQAAGYPLAIVSTKRRSQIEAILRRHELVGRFDFIIGHEDVAEHKPHPASLQLALARLGVDTAVYIGDSLSDAEAAERAGLPFVAVQTGVTPLSEFSQFPLAAVLPHVGELPAWLAGR